MPETNAISCGGRPMRRARGRSPCTTPKSPQPGHQIGLRSLLKSLGVERQRVGAVMVVIRHSCGLRRVGRAWPALQAPAPARAAARRPRAGWNGIGAAACANDCDPARARRRTCAGCGRAAPGATARRPGPRRTRGEEVAVDLLGHRIEQLRHEQLDAQALGLRAAAAPRGTRRRTLPQLTSAERRVRVALDARTGRGGAAAASSLRKRFSFMRACISPLAVGAPCLVVLDARRRGSCRRACPGWLIGLTPDVGAAGSARSRRSSAPLGRRPLDDLRIARCRSGRPSPCAARSPGRRGRSPASGSARRC